MQCLFAGFSGVHLATASRAGAGTAVGGALAGGAAGYLVDQGIPAEVAFDYERAIHDGGAIIAVGTPPGSRPGAPSL